MNSEGLRTEGEGDDAEGLLAAAYEKLLDRHEGTRLTLRDWLAMAERWRITRALRESGGNRSAAAKRLGIGRRTLYTKLEQLGIEDRAR